MGALGFIVAKFTNLKMDAKMMIRKLLLVLASLTFVGTASAGSATVLTFDGLPQTYTNFSSYTEAGYTFTLYGGSGVSQTHIGDGTSQPDTLNWHDDGDNGYGAYISLTKDGGGLFDLTILDIRSMMSISATGYTTQNFSGDQTAYALNFLAVSQIDFRAGDVGGGIDNVNVKVTANVPEPVSLALFGLGLVGLGLRRRKA